MIQKYSPFAILSLVPLVFPWVAFGSMNGGDRTGDMAGMGGLLVLFVFGISTIAGLILVAASFLFREKLRLLSLVGLFPFVFILLQFRSHSKAETERMQQAQAHAAKEQAESSEWYERYRANPELLQDFDPRTAGNGQRCALEKALSSQPLDLDLEFLGRLFEKSWEVQYQVLKHPKINAEFLLQRFPEALRQDMDGKQSPLEFMVRHPEFPEAQLKEVATSLDVAGHTLESARREYRSRTGMAQEEIHSRSNHDYSGDPQPPGDVLPPIPSRADREVRKQK